MIFYSLLAICIGATLGAWLRWGLGVWLNPLAYLPLGTLSANLLGGYLVGVFVAIFELYPGLAPEWRLFIITGFLGGLTTFSTFSSETVTLLLRGEYGWGVTIIVAHLCGSLLMTVFGIQTIKWLHA
jgi:CrcB protein